MRPYYDDGKGIVIWHGDCREVLPTLEECSVHCCVTSPPYWGLRSYLPDVVRLREDLSTEEIARVLAKLEQKGILPLDATGA